MSTGLMSCVRENTPPLDSSEMQAEVSTMSLPSEYSGEWCSKSTINELLLHIALFPQSSMQCEKVRFCFQLKLPMCKFNADIFYPIITVPFDVCVCASYYYILHSNNWLAGGC